MEKLRLIKHLYKLHRMYGKGRLLAAHMALYQALG